MAIPTFIQKSRINEVIYQIRDDVLHVSTRSLVGRFQDHQILLRNLDPEYLPRTTRNYALLLVPLIGFLLTVFILYGLMQQTLLPEESLFHLIQMLAMFGLGSLLAAIRGSRRIEYYQFNDSWGRPALFIIREPAQARECADFIVLLVSHVQVALTDLPLEERRVLLHATGAGENLAALGPGQNKWLASLLLGVIAVSFPLIPAVEYARDPSLFPIIFLLCTSGAALCVFSFLANEPRRWWSVLGLVLSLIPPFFY